MSKNSIFYAILALVILITFIGFPLDLMPPDAALYASISKTMVLNNDYINLYSLGTDWLDKPHLPFWLTALSFKLFGFSNFAYKLPGVLIFFYGAYTMYLFAKENYNKQTALTAVIILLTSLHIVISNFDVKAEPFLTGFIMASLYWFYKYIQQKTWKHLLLGSLFCAFAIMTKGIFALIPIVAAIAGNLLVKKQWKEILNPMWIFAFVFIAVFIIPELYALYIQFDAQPDKVVFGKTNVSGIKFFLWDSQFGRFFNTGPIKGKGDVFFFLHTILWAFLPWSILFYIATVLKIKRNFKIVNHKEEFYTIFGTLATILVFSLSKFQLAHYTNIVFPFMAIITADFIIKLKDQYFKLQKTFVITQWFLIGIVTVAIPLLSFLMLPEFNFSFLIILAISIATILFVKKKEQEKIKRLFYYSAITFCFLYGFMLTHFYPTLFNYQGGVHAAKFSNNNNIETVYLIDNKTHKFGFEFYLNNPVIRVPKEDVNLLKGKTFYADQQELQYLKENNYKYSILKAFDSYRITKLKGSFLNHNSRAEKLNKKYLIVLQ
ncbi:ArnT family glycosyltransferase [Tenacibaculum amylolyticum]|uniref:ArnT family glycosyltransferase n=1 Tax=Tenacibaculum amylolyticum TaxID=104269 RepID=UPI0038944870